MYSVEKKRHYSPENSTTLYGALILSGCLDQ